MNESTGEKTEPPSPKKIRDARAKGQVAKSQEVVTAASLIAVVATIWFTWRHTMEILLQLLDQVAALSKGSFSASATNALALVFWGIASILLPIIGVTILAGVAANYLQIGSIFAFENIKP